mmetsp:Transcript_99242/g.265418  ORF Transcript_99242/g.265418 Transcript_99242/m.265418 type:complete len:268 (+) Transcript_99242:113-916(+)
MRQQVGASATAIVSNHHDIVPVHVPLLASLVPSHSTRVREPGDLLVQRTTVPALNCTVRSLHRAPLVLYGRPFDVIPSSVFLAVIAAPISAVLVPTTPVVSSIPPALLPAVLSLVVPAVPAPVVPPAPVPSSVVPALAAPAAVLPAVALLPRSTEGAGSLALGGGDFGHHGLRCFLRAPELLELGLHGCPPALNFFKLALGLVVDGLLGVHLRLQSFQCHLTSLPLIGNHPRILVQLAGHLLILLLVLSELLSQFIHALLLGGDVLF